MSNPQTTYAPFVLSSRKKKIPRMKPTLDFSLANMDVPSSVKRQGLLHSILLFLARLRVTPWLPQPSPGNLAFMPDAFASATLISQQALPRGLPQACPTLCPVWYLLTFLPPLFCLQSLRSGLPSLHSAFSPSASQTSADWCHTDCSLLL